MARINKVEKSRKELRCSKCGKTVPVGSAYVWAKPRYGGKIIRCTACGLASWETSSSNYVQTVGNIVTNWRNEYDIMDTTAEDIAGALEELKDECEGSLENMPESLQYGPTGEMLQERIDELDSVISDLEGLDIESYKSDALGSMEQVEVDREEFVDYYGEDNVNLSEDEMNEEVIMIELTDLPNYEDYDEVIELPFLSNETKEALEKALEEAFGEAIDDALSNLSF